MKTVSSENRKLIVDKFQEYLDANYHQFCGRHEVNPSTKNMITFMIDQNLIAPVSIKRYTVIEEYQNLIQKTDTQKTKTVLALSDKFNIPERTIWSILNKLKR